ncbi:MAG: phosphotransferase enzyme family protein, partial [Candidatus Marinimicrobia bacterium]|nr:phosphotransferase enzyme family protein [Candidatus Neomarinimicrobiota bacterium]
MKSDHEILLIRLFENWAGDTVLNISRLPGSGSYREYFRISGKAKNALGVYNPDPKENRAFIEFARHFRNEGLNVPQVYADDAENRIYLIEDLGEQTLYTYLSQVYKNGVFAQKLTDLYKKVIAHLPRFQIQAGKKLNYAYCYPRASFDKQSMMWDLNYFKYYFL